MLKRTFSLSKEGSRTLIKASLSMALFNVATLLPVFLLASVTDEMLKRSFGFTEDALPLWPYWGVALILLIVIFLTYKNSYRQKYCTSGKEDMRLRMELAEKIRMLPLSYLNKRNLSDLTSVIMDDVAVSAHALANAVTELCGGALSGIIALGVLSIIDWRLGLALAACLPVAILVMALSRRISEGTNEKNRKRKLAVSEGLQEYLENIKILRASPQMRTYQKGLEKRIRGILPGLILYELLAGFTISISYNTMRLGLGLVIIVGSTMLLAGEVSSAIFFLFLYAAVRVYEPLTKSCESLGELIHSLVSAGRISDLLGLPVQSGGDSKGFGNYDIVFDHVSFGYNQKQVIHDVSFTARQGEITAFVGPSGSGKSTLCRLAARFWDTQQGGVYLGGVNINTVAPDTLLQNYSFVFQDVVLFNDSIYNNIKIGKGEATEEEVHAAAELACCDDFIRRLPEGYNTVIGENGKTLSGGERQRLSIARAFLKDAPVILLDESTASIDPENETRIQEAISRLIQNKTVLIVAHKLRSVVDCDRIVVLEEGHLQELGTHDELMGHQGLYHRLFCLQEESMAWTVTTASEC